MTPRPCPYFTTPSHTIFQYAPASVTPGHAGVPRVTHQGPSEGYRPFCAARTPRLSSLGWRGGPFSGGMAFLPAG